MLRWWSSRVPLEAYTGTVRQCGVETNKLQENEEYLETGGLDTRRPVLGMATVRLNAATRPPESGWDLKLSASQKFINKKTSEVQRLRKFF